MSVRHALDGRGDTFQKLWRYSSKQHIHFQQRRNIAMSNGQKYEYCPVCGYRYRPAGASKVEYIAKGFRPVGADKVEITANFRRVLKKKASKKR
jgi:hypothetical protein